MAKFILVRLFVCLSVYVNKIVLFLQAQEIDALYFKKDAVDMIDFPEEVVKEFQEGRKYFAYSYSYFVYYSYFAILSDIFMADASNE